MCIYALVVSRVYICWLVLLKSYNSGCFICFYSSAHQFLWGWKRVALLLIEISCVFSSFFTISFVFFSGAHVVCNLCSELVHEFLFQYILCQFECYAQDSPKSFCSGLEEHRVLVQQLGRMIDSLCFISFLHFWIFGCWFTLNKFLALLDVCRLKETERLLLQKMGGQWWWTKVVGKKIQMRVGFQLELWM